MSRRKLKQSRWIWRVLLAVAAVPALYSLAALLGSLIPVNAGWQEPDRGVTIYVADNGIHADLILPVRAAGLDWEPLLPKSDVAAADRDAQWLAFGAGERAVYLETPHWRDLRLPVAMRALTRGTRIVHVEWVADPGYAQREIRLRPEEYRRLWATVRAEFRSARPQRIAHKGYGRSDAFYLGVGHVSALRTCNSWTADRLRLAGVKTSLWPPFVQGLVWRYRETGVMPAKAGTSGR